MHKRSEVRSQSSETQIQRKRLLHRPLTSPVAFDSRGHFFAAAAEAMRRILIDQARRKRGAKGGGHFDRQPLEETEIAAPQVNVDLLELDEALSRLAAADAVAAEVVKLRFFTGLTMEEAAQALEMSPRSAYYIWTYARSWLHRELNGEVTEPIPDAAPDRG